MFRLQSELFFINKKNKYVWDETVQLFRKLRNIDEGLNQSDFFKMQVEVIATGFQDINIISLRVCPVPK